MHSQSTTPNPSIAAWLGYGGLVPFIFLAFAAVAGGIYGSLWNRALFSYGAVILSFVGALHWAFAMSLPDLDEPRRNSAFAWSVVPALLAWVALLLAPRPAAILLVVGFLAQYGQDRRLASAGALPAWYLPLRGRLTTVACLCLAVGGFAARSRDLP